MVTHSRSRRRSSRSGGYVISKSMHYFVGELCIVYYWLRTASPGPMLFISDSLQVNITLNGIAMHNLVNKFFFFFFTFSKFKLGASKILILNLKDTTNGHLVQRYRICLDARGSEIDFRHVPKINFWMTKKKLVIPKFR